MKSLSLRRRIKFKKAYFFPTSGNKKADILREGEFFLEEGPCKVPLLLLSAPLGHVETASVNQS